MTAITRTLVSARLGRVPTVVLAAIAAGWLAAVAAQAGGAATALHHDALIEDGPGPLAGLVLFVLAWQLMIAAMMLPSSLPMIGMFATASARQPRAGLAMAAFIGGYALVWTAFGALAFGFDMGVHAAVEASPWLRQHDWLISASVLALAGAFQFTSLKDACLDKCRHPGQFMIRFYERGVAGGFRMGAHHGLFCLGCCWALMLVMFAAGVASLMWMAVLALVMVYEKTQPAGRRAVPATGVMLLATAVLVAVGGSAL